MLSNAYFLAKFRFDTAENEPAKNLQNLQKMQNLPILINFANFATQKPVQADRVGVAPARAEGQQREPHEGPRGERARHLERTSRGRTRADRRGIGQTLEGARSRGCIEAKFCKKICV